VLVLLVPILVLEVEMLDNLVLAVLAVMVAQRSHLEALEVLILLAAAVLVGSVVTLPPPLALVHLEFPVVGEGETLLVQLLVVLVVLALVLLAVVAKAQPQEPVVLHLAARVGRPMVYLLAVVLVIQEPEMLLLPQRLVVLVELVVVVVVVLAQPEEPVVLVLFIFITKENLNV
jgi:hypothetical protein